MKKICKLHFVLFLAAGLLCGCAKMLDDIAPKNQIKVDMLSQSDVGKLTNGVRFRMESGRLAGRELYLRPRL